MRIIGCDLHARQQTLAMLDTISGEVVNRTLMHEGNEVREFYSQLPHPVLPALTRRVATQSYSGSIAASWCRKVWGRRAWQWHESWESGCGSCCETRLITKSSVVVDRSKAVMPVRGCLKRGLVRMVTVRLIRLPASLSRKGVRITHHGLR